MKKLTITRTIVLFLCMAACSCAKTPPDKNIALSDPLNELIRICHDEHNLKIVVTPFEHTVWIYLPFEEKFLEFKGTAQGPLHSDQPATKPVIKFLDGWFKDGNFTVKYDIGPAKGYAKDYGYASNFTQEYQTAQRNILSAISRVYSSREDSTDGGNAPDFFVIAMADIVNGLESRVWLHLKDLQRAYVDQSFHEEYAKRVVSEQPFGDEKIIGDKEGGHIQYYDITWPDFLVKQMIFRTEFKYQRSSFPPSNDTQNELLTIAADTVDAYNFTDFTSVRLHNLDDGATFTITRDGLSAYKNEPSQGRLIHIQFQ